MLRRFIFFGFGALISIILLSLGPENRFKKTFYNYIDYFNMNKRVIYHLENNSINFSVKAECQLVYYDITEAELLNVLDDGKVNFRLSDTEMKPCKYYVIENKLNALDLMVSFKFCDKDNLVEVISFKEKGEDEVCY